MAGVSTDTVGLRVKPGSFVVKRGSSILNEKLLDKILGKKPKGYAGGGTVPITATPEERIASPEEVAMYGIDFFRAVNNSSDNATHPERMDALIAQSELAGMKPMLGGGEVAPGYENGGSVPKSILNIPFSLLANALNKPVPRTSTVLSPEEQILMELESGAHFPKTDVPSPEEEILSELINVAKQKEQDRPIASPFKGYQEGDEVRGYRQAGVKLEPDFFKTLMQFKAPEGEEGTRWYEGKVPLGEPWTLESDIKLSKLDAEAIRDALETMATAPQDSIPSDNIKNWWKGSQFKGYQEGDEVSPEQYAGLIGKMIGKFGGEVPEGMYTPEGGLTRAGYAKMIGASPESVDIDTMSFINPANYSFKVSGKGAESGADVGGTTTASVLPLKALLDKTMRQNIKDPFERMDWQMRLGDVKPAGYQDGDVVGYQQGEQVVDPNDPLGINERQAMGAQAYAGSTIAGAGGGVSVGDVAEAVEIDEMQKANQAMEALKLQGIYNEPERSGYFEFQGDVPQSEADQMRMVFSLLRDMENQKALNQLLMQTGRMGGQLKPREQGLFFKPK